MWLVLPLRDWKGLRSARLEAKNKTTWCQFVRPTRNHTVSASNKKKDWSGSTWLLPQRSSHSFPQKSERGFCVQLRAVEHTPATYFTCTLQDPPPPNRTGIRVQWVLSPRLSDNRPSRLLDGSSSAGPHCLWTFNVVLRHCDPPWASPLQLRLMFKENTLKTFTWMIGL